jgi:hypothetical protein
MMQMAETHHPDMLRRAVVFFVVLAIGGVVLGLTGCMFGNPPAVQPRPVYPISLCAEGTASIENCPLNVSITTEEGSPSGGDQAIAEKSHIFGPYEIKLPFQQPMSIPPSNEIINNDCYNPYRILSGC